MTPREASGNELLRNAVEAAIAPYSTYPSTYREIREHFMSGHKVETKRLAEALGISTRQVLRYEKFVTGEPGQSRNPDNARGKTRESLINVGKTLDPIKKDAPPNGLTITVEGKQGSGRRERGREFTVSMGYNDAVKFVQDPNLRDFFGDVYPEWDEAVDCFFGEEDSSSLDGVSVTAA